MIRLTATTIIRWWGRCFLPFYFFTFLPFLAVAQPTGVVKHISSADGLSNDFVISLAIDGQGHLWVGTEAGVNRIAGKSVVSAVRALTSLHSPLTSDLSPLFLFGRTTALHWHAASGNMLIGTEHGLVMYCEAEGTMSLQNATDGLVASSVNDIAEAADGGVWLVYGNGAIQHFDCTTRKARNLPLSQQHGNRCAMDDGHGHLYIGHSQHGMTVVNIADGTSRNYVEHADADALPGNNVRCIRKATSAADGVWVGTDAGLALFSPATGTFRRFSSSPQGSSGKPYDDNVYDIHQTADGRLWVATDIGGLKTFGPLASHRSSLTSYRSPLTTHLSSLNTRCIVEDEYGNLWVGNHGTGVDFISAEQPHRSGITVLSGLTSPNSPLTSDHSPLTSRHQPMVSAMARDTQEGIWMATENELLLWHNDSIMGRWNTLGNIRREYVLPRSLMADSHGGVWVGLDDQGVYRFDKLSQRFAHIPVSPEGSDIHCFAEDAEGRVWIGGEAGVYVYENGKATVHQLVSRTIHAPATCIMQTAPHRLFVATLGDGIYSIDMQHGTSRHMSTGEGLPSSKVNHSIRSQQGGLWIATDGGLVSIDDPVTLKGIHVYGREQGLTDPHVLAVQQSDDGRLWMSTYSGISCLVPATGRCYHYTHQDTRLTGGLASGAAITDSQGRVLFGSADGVCCVVPRLVGSSSRLSEVQIISCEAYNPVGRNTEIRQLVPDKDGCMVTTYKQNTIRLTFAMRDYAQTEQVDYSYMMEGMDGKWYDIGNDHDVVFRGLRPGRYTFILRAKLRSQDWDQARQARLSITITPPFWLTWWAFVLYVLTAIAVTTYLVRQYKRKLTLRNALELERRESRQKQEMNEERLRFFTNVTHELRTPLTLILGPLDDLTGDHSLTMQAARRVAIIRKNAERLKELIDDILEFRKTETQNRRLTVARGDIGRFVQEICLNYKELNRNDKVRFVCHVVDGLPMVWFDSEVITTVLNNLLSNAVKYTEEGTITTIVDMAGSQLSITVADTGYGISPEALPHIFDRYYQASGTHQASGTGIGLALVKSLAELHEGTIIAESREGQGSRFTLTLDASNTYPHALHKEDEENENISMKHHAATTEAGDGEEEPETVETLPKQLLVVEDNADIRQYIADTFSDDFRILQAANGEEGVQMAIEHTPDIIVSDIMMPRKNGIELTRELKSDIRTSHIPIILLTAKDTDDEKEEGYDSGADSYLTKPFSAKLLASRIRNLLAARRRLTELIAATGQSHVSTDHAVASSQGQAPAATPFGPAAAMAQLSPLDQAFLDHLNSIIEEHIMKEDIDMAFVTDKMAMSHSTFYRKVKALTGMTATEYIRKCRLRHCYRLLQQGDYNVSQAAMMTGFNQMGHFRETFKREFGILPSEVKKVK